MMGRIGEVLISQPLPPLARQLQQAHHRARHQAQVLALLPRVRHLAPHQRVLAPRVHQVQRHQLAVRHQRQFNI